MIQEINREIVKKYMEQSSPPIVDQWIAQWVERAISYGLRAGRANALNDAKAEIESCFSYGEFLATNGWEKLGNNE